jgi:hypothetical protein
VSYRKDGSRRLGRIAGGLAALTLSLGLVSGAMAANSVTTRVTGGTLTASIANLNLGNVRTSHIAVNKSGTMKLTADDSTGTGFGWNVTVQASDFAYTGTVGGIPIPATGFSLDAAGAPVETAGQIADASNGPMVPATSPVGSLDQIRKVTTTNPNFGQGTYAQDLDVTLSVPANSRVGTYTSTLTVTIVAGP